MSTPPKLKDLPAVPENVISENEGHMYAASIEKLKEALGIGGKLDYALGWMSSTGYWRDFNFNQSTYWNAFETNNDDLFSRNGSTYYQIRIKPGVYKLSGMVCGGEYPNTDFYRGFKWYNVTLGQFIGSEGGWFDNPSYANGGSGPSIAYIHLTQECLFELRCVKAYGDFDFFSVGTSFNIERLNATSL